MRFEFYIPSGSEQSDEVKHIQKLLPQINASNKIMTLRSEKEQELGFNTHVRVPVSSGIEIKKARRTKSYPQSRGNEEIKIEDILYSFMNRKRLKCHHELSEFSKKDILRHALKKEDLSKDPKVGWIKGLQ